jgi:D-glycero-D-manno-heptose 1,7-bisphosphate phosphatase
MPARSICSGHDVSAQPKPGIYVPGGVLSAVTEKGRRALFLDRDGVINVNHGYVHTAEQTEWVPGIFELCATARDAGYKLVVVTNQAGIARGYYSESEFLDYTRWVHEEFAAQGIEILATLYCPHHPTAGFGEFRVECGCRKPAPGMFTAAIHLLGLAPKDSVMLGDKDSDLIAAASAGIPELFLIDSNKPDAFDASISYLRFQT